MVSPLRFDQSRLLEPLHFQGTANSKWAIVSPVTMHKISSTRFASLVAMNTAVDALPDSSRQRCEMNHCAIDMKSNGCNLSIHWCIKCDTSPRESTGNAYSLLQRLPRIFEQTWYVREQYHTQPVFSHVGSVQSSTR